MNNLEAYNWLKQNLPNFEQREITRQSRDFIEFILPWNTGKFNIRSKVGSLMSAIGSLPEDVTRNEWYEFYLRNVRSPFRVMNNIQELSQKVGLPLETAAEYWCIHILDMSWQGNRDEIDCINLLRLRVAPKGFKVRRATEKEDLEYGVDAIIYEPDSGKIISGVQIKGVPYFFSKKYTVVQARTQINPKKYAKFKEVTGAPVYYMLIRPSLDNGYCVIMPAPHLAPNLPANIQVLL